MTDKTRTPQRPLRAPPGFLPNWLVAAVAVAGAAILVIVTSAV